MISEEDREAFLALLDFESEHADLPDYEYFEAKKVWEEERLPFKPRS